MDDHTLGAVLLSVGMIFLVAMNLFSPWGTKSIEGVDPEYVSRDKIILFTSLVILYISLALVFISYQGEDMNYISGLYLAIIIITLLLSFGYNTSYGVILLLMIALIVIVIVIYNRTKKFYLIITVLVLIAGLLLQTGIYT